MGFAEVLKELMHFLSCLITRESPGLQARVFRELFNSFGTFGS
jgi:hypothetical protein